MEHLLVLLGYGSSPGLCVKVPQEGRRLLQVPTDGLTTKQSGFRIVKIIDSTFYLLGKSGAAAN